MKEKYFFKFLRWFPVPIVVIIPFIGHGWCMSLFFVFCFFLVVGSILWRSIFICISGKSSKKNDISFHVGNKGTFILILHTLLFFGRYAVSLDDILLLTPIFMLDIFLTPFYATAVCIGLDSNVWSVLIFGFGGTIMWTIISGLCFNEKHENLQ